MNNVYIQMKKLFIEIVENGYRYCIGVSLMLSLFIISYISVLKTHARYKPLLELLWRSVFEMALAFYSVGLLFYTVLFFLLVIIVLGSSKNKEIYKKRLSWIGKYMIHFYLSFIIGFLMIVPCVMFFTLSI